jgi:hypothetical protein
MLLSWDVSINFDLDAIMVAPLGMIANFGPCKRVSPPNALR